MAQAGDIPRVAMQVSRGVVVASIQFDLSQAVLAQLQEDLLQRIHASGARGVILDVSGLEMLDPSEFAALRRVIAMASLMGARAVLVGLRPGVVSSLIATDADVEGLSAVLDLDAAFRLLEAAPDAAPAGDGEALPVEPEGAGR